MISFYQNCNKLENVDNNIIVCFRFLNMCTNMLKIRSPILFPCFNYTQYKNAYTMSYRSTKQCTFRQREIIYHGKDHFCLSCTVYINQNVIVLHTHMHRLDYRIHEMLYFAITNESNYKESDNSEYCLNIHTHTRASYVYSI